MDTIQNSAFFDELEKISASGEAQPLITKARLKSLVRHGLIGAAGTGLGYGVGELVGRPLERKLLQLGTGARAAKILRYAVPTVAGLGAGLTLARNTAVERLLNKVEGANESRSHDPQR